MPNLFLVINKVLQTYDFEKVKRDVESVYKCEVAGVLPLSEDLVEMGSREVFLSQSSGAYLFSENRRNRKQDDHCLGSSILFGGRAVNDSTIALENQAEEYLLRLAKNQADISNTLFEKVESGC
ncbi:MAG: hypothetical protein N2V78_09625 [Methanophagales archaeon]|nr:hypothetical protein [Methanophagales archaeon]